VVVFVDPRQTTWIAWNDTQTVSRADGNFPGRLFLWGGGGFGTDDFIRLTVTNPQGATLTVDMDNNDTLGVHRPTDPMRWSLFRAGAGRAPGCRAIRARGSW